MPSGRCIMTVHAHPDDESSKGPATIARYVAEGAKAVLVCCTGGEEGEILNPAVVLAEGEEMGERRAAELDEAAAIIGYHEVVRLGYRDSGMPDSPANADPRSFWSAPLEEAVARLVRAIRLHQPQVLITYPDEQHRYPHPDHLRAHEIAAMAFEQAADPGFHPELGEAHEVAKLYYTVWPAIRMAKLHEAYCRLGLESPYDEGFLMDVAIEERFTTIISVAGRNHVRDSALAAHATQIDPNSRYWFGLPQELREEIHPFDHYLLARSRVGSVDVIEDDLFAGIG